MSSHTPVSLTGGIYVPLVTPFKSSKEQELDTETLKKHVTRIAGSGCGIVLLGTNGEGENEWGSGVESCLLSTSNRAFSAPISYLNPLTSISRL